MKFLLSLTFFCSAFALSSCGGKKEDPTDAADWQPKNASVAVHISSVHGFIISDTDEAHLKVEKVDRDIVAKFRDDVLKDLGGEKALFVFSWETNPQTISKPEYLYFLEALHAYLVLNAPKWDGGEKKQ